MKPALALVVLFMSACAGRPADPSTAPQGRAPSGIPVQSHVPISEGRRPQQTETCLPYDAGAPLNLQKAVESTNNGVEVSAISFSSPGGGSVTGLLFDPVTRSSLRPGFVLMHGMPGNNQQASFHRLDWLHEQIVSTPGRSSPKRGIQRSRSMMIFGL